MATVDDKRLQELGEWMFKVQRFATLFMEHSYYAPKQHYSSNLKVFYTYVQPIVLLALIFWIISLSRALWTQNFFKKYGSMIIYSCVDILALLIQNTFLVYAFTLTENYMQYEMCYAFKFTANIIPSGFYLISQWFRVAHSFQIFILFYKPMHHEKILNRLTFGIYVTVMILTACGFGSLYFWNIDLEKVVVVNKETKQPVEICRQQGAFSVETFEKQNRYHSIITLIDVIFSSILSVIFMTVFTSISFVLIRRRVIFRRRSSIAASATVIASERLIKVTIASTVFHTIISIPQISIVILTLTEYDNFKIVEYAALINTIMALANIPINFRMFSWLSNGFRQKLLDAKEYLRRKIST